MKLVIEGDEGRKSVVPVRDEMTIGRDDGNTVRLPDRNVSRRHARLFKDSGRLLIEDLGSFNGVRVNGRKIGTPTAVKEGDLIEVGDYELSVQGKLDGKDANPASSSGRTNGGGSASDLVEASKVELRDLADAEAPRLFGLSGPVRGKEFHLTRTEVKLGRGSENDLAIDHPSVSRAHARFFLDSGHWKVIDEHSANGIRINGEEYVLGTLDPGDTIELGQLRFRFCAPGEKFTLPAGSAPDESASETRGTDDSRAADQRAGSAVRLGGVAMLLLTAVASAWWFFGGRNAKRARHGETAPFAAAPAVAEPAGIEASQPAANPAQGTNRVESTNPAPPERASASNSAAGASMPSANPERAHATRSPPARAPETPAAAAIPPAPAAPAAPDEAKEAQATRLAAASNEKLNAHDFEGAVSDAQAALDLAPTGRDTLCTAYHTLGYGFSYLNDNRSAKKYLEQFKPCCASFGETACAQVEEFLAR